MYRILLSLIVALGIDTDAQAHVTGFTDQASYKTAAAAELLFFGFNGITPGTDGEMFSNHVDTEWPAATTQAVGLFSASVVTNAQIAFQLGFSGSSGPQTMAIFTRRRL